MKFLGDIGQLIGGVLALAFTILVFYLLYLTLAWSWDLLLWAAGVAVVGLILLSVALNTEDTRAKRARRGEENATSDFMLVVVAHAGRGLATAAFAIAAGLVAAAIFQGAVLSRDDLYASDLQSYEESLLYAKLWLDRVLGLDVLAGILALLVAASLVLPLKSLVERALSVRRVLSFFYVALVTLTSFTFFAGLALKPYELSLRNQLRMKAAFAFESQHLDQRKSLVAVAWILDKLEDPGAQPIPPDLAERLAEYLQRSPYHEELDSAAWRIAGFKTVLYFSEDASRREDRHKGEVDVLAQDSMANEDVNADALASPRAFVTGIFGDTFSWLKPEGGTQAWHYLRVLGAVEPAGRAPASWENSPLVQARTAAVELLSSLLADKIGGAVTSEALSSHFVGELVQAVVTPLWDVVLPLDIKDVASARTFVAAQRLDRAALDWSKVADMAPLAAEQTASAAPETGGGPSTGLGSTSHLAVPMGMLPSWQSFGGSTAFVVRPQVGAPEVYTRPVVRFR